MKEEKPTPRASDIALTPFPGDARPHQGGRPRHFALGERIPQLTPEEVQALCDVSNTAAAEGVDEEKFEDFCNASTPPFLIRFACHLRLSGLHIWSDKVGAMLRKRARGLREEKEQQ